MDSPERTQPGKALVNIILANAVWWLLPVVVLLMAPDADALSLVLASLFAVALVIAIPLCVRCRNSVWIVSIWTPAFAGSVIGAGKLWLEFAVALSVMFGGEAAVVCGGLASLLSLAAVVFLIFHPRVGAASGVALALATLAIANMAAVSYVTREACFRAIRQDIIVHVIDPKGSPISGATVSYQVYGYGDLGARPSRPDITGRPTQSDRNGIAGLHSLQMRHEVEGVITKPGFRTILFNLDMQYNKWDTTRLLRISTPESGIIADQYIPSKEPVEFSIYLPPEADSPEPIQCIDAKTGLSGTGNLKCFLDVETGRFSQISSGDLEFEASFTFDGRVRQAHLELTGINGSSVVQFEPTTLSGTNLSPYEAVYLIAPESGYSTNLTVNESGNEPTVYVRARDGHLFVRLVPTLILRRSENDTEYRNWSVSVYAKIYKNPNGSRLLESRWMP